MVRTQVYPEGDQMSLFEGFCHFQLAAMELELTAQRSLDFQKKVTQLKMYRARRTSGKRCQSTATFQLVTHQLEDCKESKRQDGL